MKFNKKVLSNGLTVLHEKREVPVTKVMLATKFGAINESESEKGIAHFIEHLCFKGTKKRNAREIASSLEKVGGILNAFTSEQETAYHVKLPSQHLELAMDVIFDIFFNPEFPEEEIEKEGNVICEEIKMYNDDPRRHTMDMIKRCLYKEPFGMSIAGVEENIRKMGREQLLKKHSECYHPKNAILCVVGNNDFEEIVNLAEKFSVDRKGLSLEKQELSLINSQKIENRSNLQQANLCIGIHFPKLSEKERYAAEVFTAILGEGMSSKLFTEVREKRGPVYTVHSYLDIDRDYGYMYIYAGTDREKVNEVIKICIEEFKEMKNISKEELEDGKKQVIGNYYVESEDSDNTAVNLIFEEMSGKAEDYYKYPENIEKVSLEDIKKIADLKEYSYFILSP